jgi:hypothetical protein
MKTNRWRVYQLLAVLGGLLALVAGAGCGSDNIARPEPSPSTLLGVWGGQSIRMTVGPHASEIIYDCGEGAIRQAIELDPDGRFVVEGTFAATPGPMPVEGWPTHPAIHAGTVHGTAMTLTVTLTDGTGLVGSFRLTRGEQGMLIRCQ